MNKAVRANAPPVPMTYLTRRINQCCVAGVPAADASSKYPEPGIGFRVVCFLRVPHKAQAVIHVPARP